MNVQERRAYSDHYQSRIKLFERKYLKNVDKTITDQYDRILHIAKTDGFRKALSEVDHYLIDGDLMVIIKQLYEDVGLYFIPKYLKEINQAARQKHFISNYITKDGRLGFSQTWIEQILDYFRMHLLNGAVLPVTQTSRNEIRAVLNTAIQQGWSYEKMASHINSLPRYRALRIVRTETAKAAGAARIISVRDSDFELQKEWITAEDARVRYQHNGMDGVVIDENDLFDVWGDRMTGPGDPTADPSNIINCRCTLAFIPKRDSSGRLIMKK